MQITVFGCGYVGLVTGACLASLGHIVECIDVDDDRVAALKNGVVPFFEPGMDALINNKNLSFAVNPLSCDISIIAVGSPLAADGSADLSQVFDAARMIANMEQLPQVVVVKSTVPTGTCQKIADKFGLNVVSNPEFLRQGSAIQDFMHPDRVIIGASDAQSFALMQQLYAPLNLPDDRILRTSLNSAELTKYAANVFLTTKLAFVNELARYCETIGANIDEVTKGIGLDSRIGPQFLQAGPGIGGSCFPKDIRALAYQSRSMNHPLEIVEMVIAANETHQRAMLQKIVDICGGNVNGLNIAILGVTFKAGTDDVRNSIALQIIPKLQRLGANITATDPQAGTSGMAQLGNVTWHKDAYLASQNADAVVLLTEWPEFAALDLHRLANGMASPRLVDLRNAFNADQAQDAGFTYVSIGR